MSEQNLPEWSNGRVPFEEVFKAELEGIALRRKHIAEAAGSGSGSSENSIGSILAISNSGEFSAEEPVLNAVGLSLSGGGIRSAAFCLGVLQALDKADVLKRIDYLSTVSGGGYIGSSLTAGQSHSDGAFPFESKLDSEETPSVKHIRNYSNYLIPHGPADLLESLVIYLRGLVANVILVLPWLLFAAYITVRSHPTYEHLTKPSLLRLPIPNIFPFNYFVLSAYLALVLLALFAGWTLIKSLHSQLGKPDVPSKLTKFFGYALVAFVIIAFFELQPLILNRIGKDGINAVIEARLQHAMAVLAPLAGAIALLSGKLAGVVKRGLDTPGGTSRAKAYAAKAIVYVAAALVPLLLWAFYFQISWWAIGSCAAFSPECTIQTQYPGAPGWLRTAADTMFGGKPYPIASFYLLCFGILVILSMCLRPNANSLHRLYRDRLSKAFLFKPQDVSNGKDPTALDRKRLSSLSAEYSPYHLLNTALNIQGSRHVNRRGRDADFFMFSARYVGSEATGYVSTKAMEDCVPELDLGTAMAVSAAAASSNMGAQSIKPLTPTLALLNVRVGFWIRNPMWLATSKLKASIREFISLFFLYELIANLREDNWNVYVTDGGHLENLGAYELLKRRCRVIIVVDAEADPQMSFGSLITLERFARIDLGIRINLPWGKIAEATKAVSKDFAETGGSTQRKGPHCAVGQIEYRDGGKGVMLYIKSSLSGDENDYIADYKKRYPLFPHESTADQFFSEEQFEVYRALGFHAGYGFFEGRDNFAELDAVDFKDAAESVALLKRLFPRKPSEAEKQNQ